MKTHDEAVAEHALNQRVLRLSALAFVEAHGGVVTMQALWSHMEKLTRSDAEISRALSVLQSNKLVHLGPDRIFTDMRTRGGTSEHP